MNEYHGIGVMSGTSLDGVDIAHCVFHREPDETWRYEILHAAAVEYSPEWVDRLANLHNAGAAEYARTNVEFGHHLGRLIKDFLETNGLAPDFAACHGHTIFHQPERGFTAQIGDGETLSAHLECPVVTNFRNKDVAAGGQGAPLVPFGEKHLFPGTGLFLNLGGFANITGGGAAFDISPCNFALNAVARLTGQTYDADGNLARRGELLPDLLERLNQRPFYQQPPPKSLGREWYEREFEPLLRSADGKPEDLAHTCCRHIAFQIGRAVDTLGVRDTRILITGGGARNRFLMERLEEELRARNVVPEGDAGPFVIDFKEALIFAFLGLRTLQGLTNILPSATGAVRPVVGGSIHLPVQGTRRVFPDLIP